jgi:hypothetical protein
MQLPSISESSTITNILGIDSSGRLYYTASSAIGGGGGNAFPFNGNAVITGSLLVSQSGIIVTGSISSTAGFTGSLFGTASYITGSIFTNVNPALTASHALTASFSPNFANTNLTLTATRTHTGGGNEYRFFNSGSILNYRGGNQFIRSNDHILGVRELKGGSAYETAFIQMTTSSLVIAVGDENNVTSGLRQLTVTTSSVTITGSLSTLGSVQSTQGFTGSLNTGNAQIFTQSSQTVFSGARIIISGSTNLALYSNNTIDMGATRFNETAIFQSTAQAQDINTSGGLFVVDPIGTVPTFTGTTGQILPFQSGSVYRIYVYLNGAWRSSSLS